MRKPFYVPALRMKAGELMGIRDLAPEIADRITPRMIIPPQLERDDALQPKLFASDPFPDVSAALGQHWFRREVLVEATHLVSEFRRDRMGLWLPKMFEAARKSQVHAIPTVMLNDLLIDRDLEAYKAAVEPRYSLKLGLVVPSGDLTDAELVKKGLKALEKLRLTPEDCVVIADFSGDDFSQADIVAPIITGVMETLQATARWQQIVFQGTNYPEHNPAEPDSFCHVPRNEWLAWRKAIRFAPETADHMIFGDYAADCAKMVFRAGGAPAIRHHRYAIADAWLIQRGPEIGTQASAMRAVSEAIVTSGHFAGRTFSTADNRIYLVSKGLVGPGTAKEWRGINTTHHITRVVTDIGTVRGVTFPQLETSPLPEQQNLFA
ncbi:beta family protein [Bradyrhizobium sp. HKCCYLS2058]|uniref:beta family protein n=1 Tax=unclassified Bradyrhizobium TaxID=2631580 RepID=UPI003EBE2E4B